MAMLPIHALEFIVKHVAHKSISAIAQIAGIDAANLHACLSGKRTWPVSMVRKVAAAVGLMGSHDKLDLASGVVIYLEISGNELPKLSQTIQAIVEHSAWCLVCTTEEPSETDVHAMTIASAKGSYVVTSVRWDNIDNAVQGIDEITELLPGIWINNNPDAFSLSQNSDQWIRLRAGIEPFGTFDNWFGKKTIGIEKWAQMLLDVSQEGFRPEQITKIIKATRMSMVPPLGKMPIS